jgi:hypothetical protein
MKAIKSQNKMKQLIIFSSMLLFLLILTKNTNSQELSGKSSDNIEGIEVKAGTPNTILFKTISSQLEAELIANAPLAYEEGTLVSYSFPKEMFVELKVYDKSGRELKTLTSETKDPGSYSTDLNMLNLKKGTYYYKLSIGSDISVKKVVLLN